MANEAYAAPAKGMSPAELRKALLTMRELVANPNTPMPGGGGPAGPPRGSRAWYLVKARELQHSAYDPWKKWRTEKMVKEKGQGMPGVTGWITRYWDWLAGGAKTSTVRPEKQMSAGETGTQYLTDQGWQTQGQLDPQSARAKYIKAKMEAAELDTGDPQKYWEGWKAPGGYDYTTHNEWTDIEGTPQWADYTPPTGLGWLPSPPQQAPPVYPPNNPPYQPIRPWGAAAGANRNLTINFGGGNREGNAATAGAAGTVSRTPGDSFYSGDGFMRQARERAAKRTGRRLSQAGVTAIPSITRLGKYQDSYLRGGF